MSVCVRLYNLPLHFWNEGVSEGIGNSLGRYIKIDIQWLEERIFTFARICLEVDLSKGLPESIYLIHINNKNGCNIWTMKIQRLGAGFAGTLGTYKTSARMQNRKIKRRRKQGKLLRGGNSL